MVVSSNQRKDQVLARLKTLEGYSRASLESQSEVQYRALRSLMNHVLTFPFWRERFGEFLPKIQSSTNLEQLLQSLPVTTRSDFQDFAPWSRLWIQGSHPADYLTLSTSGSTGKPVTVTKYGPVQNLESLTVEAMDFIWQKVDVTKPLLSYTSRTPPEQNPSKLGEPHRYLEENTGQLYFRKLE